MSKFNILSFDGGGVKGALSIEILNRLLLKYPNLLEKTDLFAGTSTGSIIACLLANNVSVSKIQSLYSVDICKKIFSPSKLNLIKPKFKNNYLKNLIDSYFDDNFLINNFKKYIFIPSFYLGDETSSWSPVFFHNLFENDYYNSKASDSILSSCSAPTYFPSYKNFIDGGVIDNSPTASSLILTLSSCKCKKEDITILSIGTGDIIEKITGKTSKWGILQWAFNPFSKMNLPLLSLLLDGMSQIEDMYCRELLKDNYFRINPSIPDFISLDDYKSIPYLKYIGQTCNLDTLYNFIEKYYLG